LAILEIILIFRILFIVGLPLDSTFKKVRDFEKFYVQKNVRLSYEKS